MLKKLAVVFLFLPVLLFGQGRKYSNEFLNIGVDARAMAMSNSVIGSVNDVTAGYWNPAGLAAIKGDWQAAAMHAEYFASIAQYDYLSYAMPVDAVSTAGVTLIRFGVDDILDTTELIDEDGNVDYDRISKFSAADYALIGSYARQSAKIPNLRYGANVKLIYRQIGDFANAIGFGFDVGAQYSVGAWQFGGNLRDVTSTFNSWSYDQEKLDRLVELGNELPEDDLELTIPRLLLGVGRSFRLNEKYSLHTEINMDVTFDGQRNTLVSSGFGNIDPGFGFELGYRNFVFLRGGAGNFQRVRDFTGSTAYTVQPNLGIGFKYRGIHIDYALTDIGNASDALYSNIFSVKLNFAAFKRS
ncbi:MAG: PorV/PorQ family protein [Owenweeksia sp.]